MLIRSANSFGNMAFSAFFDCDDYQKLIYLIFCWAPGPNSWDRVPRCLPMWTRDQFEHWIFDCQDVPMLAWLVASGRKSTVVIIPILIPHHQNKNSNNNYNTSYYMLLLKWQFCFCFCCCWWWLYGYDDGYDDDDGSHRSHRSHHSQHSHQN